MGLELGLRLWLRLGLGLVQTLNLHNPVYMKLKLGISTSMNVDITIHRLNLNPNLIPHSPLAIPRFSNIQMQYSLYGQ